MAMASLLLLLLALISGSSSQSVDRSPNTLTIRVYAKRNAGQPSDPQLLYENPNHDLVFRGPIPLQNGQYATEIVLECTASYPIQWDYNGDGWGLDSEERFAETEALKNVTVTSYQLQPQDKGSRDPEYKTTITGLVLFERISGQYRCGSRKPVEGNYRASSIHLFVPYNSPKYAGGWSLPVRTFLRYRPPNPAPGSSGLMEVTLEDFAPVAGGPGGQVLIPCSVSDPSAIVYLYKVGQDYSGQEEEVAGAVFDPKEGFTLPNRLGGGVSRGRVSEADVKALVGEYVCRVRGEGPGQAVKELRTSVVSLWSRQDPPYPLEPKFVYNSETRELRCKLDPSLQPPKEPLVSILVKVDCGEDLECEFRLPYYLGQPPTAVIRFPYSPALQEGLVLCWSREATDTGPRDRSGAGPPALWATSQHFVLDAQSKGTGLVLGVQGAILTPTAAPVVITVLDKEEITLPALDELVIAPKEEVRVGEEVRLRCYFQRSVYATGDGSWAWWVQHRGTGAEGALQPLNCSSAECRVPIKGLDLKSVHCSAPMLNGQERVTASLPLHVKGPSEPSHIKLAFVRANQDFEQIGDDEMEDQPAGHGSTYYNKTFKGYLFTPGDFGGVAGQTLYVQCRAPFPIEWTYSGYFAPEVMTTSQRYVPRIDEVHLEDQNSYYFITELIVGAFSRDYTGEYACRKIGDYKVQAKVYLYFADPTGASESSSTFLPHPEETSWLQYAKTPSGVVRSRFIVPCPVSDPLAEVSLWKKDAATEKWSRDQLPPKTQLKYNPKLGFEVYPELSGATGSTLTQTHPVTGVYECRAGAAHSQPTHVASKVEPGDSESPSPFSVTPKDSLVPLTPPRVQVLVCEGHEEVTLLFSDPALASSLVVSRNATGNTAYKYSALAIVETFKLKPGSVTTVECVPALTRGDGHPRPRVLHKWRLTDLAPGRISKFGYDNASNSYVCCSSGFLRPQMRIATTRLPSNGNGGGCHSVTECRLQACLKNNKCRSSMAQEGDGQRGRPQRVRPIESLTGPGCSTQKVDPRVPAEGALVCDLGEGDVPYVSFSYLLYHRDPDTGAEVHSTFWNMNTDAIREEGPGAAEGAGARAVELLKIRLVRPNKFLCEGSKFFFSLGFYWVLHRDGGSKEYVSGADGALENISHSSTGPVYKSTLEMSPEMIRGRGVNRVECVAPEWNSYLWRSAVIDL